MINVLFAALKYDYGKPKNGLSIEYTNFFHALSHMPGVTAEFFAIDEHTLILGRDGANNLLIKTVREKKPDLLFCYLLSEELKPETISEITGKTNTKTFNWFADDHWRIPIFSRYWAPFFSLVSTTDSEAIDLYKKYGITNVIKTQWGANQHLYMPSDPAKNPGNLDITFVGKKFGSRGDYISALEKEKLPVKAFGGGWSWGRVSEEEKLNIFSYSKINLNFSETHYSGSGAFLKQFGKLFLTKLGGRYRFVGHHILDNFRAMRGVKKLAIKGRVFEVPACGGFLMTGSSDDDISEYYIPGKEIVVFNNIPDMVEKCRYYLEHETERDIIAKAGLARTLLDHTYEKRFLEIFSKLGL